MTLSQDLFPAIHEQSVYKNMLEKWFSENSVYFKKHPEHKCQLEESV
jgi:hypothetical protein